MNDCKLTHANAKAEPKSNFYIVIIKWHTILENKHKYLVRHLETLEGVGLWPFSYLTFYFKRSLFA